MYYEKTKEKIDWLRQHLEINDNDLDKSLTEIQNRITDTLKRIK